MKNIFTYVFLLILLYADNAFSQPYQSQNISLLGKWTDPTIVAEPSHQLKYCGIWGWDDGNGNEYAIQGTANGVYVVNVTNPSSPVQVGFLEGGRPNCLYHEAKTYSHYAYITSDDGPSNVFQIIDLQYLPDSIHVVYNDSGLFERVHTMWIDGNKLYCASVKGGQFTFTKMAVFSLANPEMPALIATVDVDYPTSFSYVHDMFVRNDTVFASAGYDGLFIYHFNSATNHFEYINSLTTYPSQGYNHSSALTADGHTLIFADEVPAGLPMKSLNVSNLQAIGLPVTFSSSNGATPHNPFIVGNTCYIGYYQEGLQVYDVSNVSNPVRIGYFDTHDQSPLGGPFTADPYAGAWGAYPFLPSGRILVSDMQNGLFILDGSAMLGINSPDPEISVGVYPNPVKAGEKVIINSGTLENTTLSVCDVQGKICIDHFESLDGEYNLNTKGLSAGIYLLKIGNSDGEIIKKLVIE